MDEVDEQDLLRRAKKLDEDALSTVFDTYYDPIYRYVYHHVGRHQSTAEDLTSEVFKRFLEQLQAGSGPDNYLKAWLYKVARNLVIDESRKQKHRNHSQLDERFMAEDTHIASEVRNLLMFERAIDALDTLSDMERQIITLKFVEGMENDEISHILDTTKGSIRVLQHRALRKLRQHLIRDDIL